MVGREERAKLLRDWQESPKGFGSVVKCAAALMLLILGLVAGVNSDQPLNSTRIAEPAMGNRAGEEIIESRILEENGTLPTLQTSSRESRITRTPDSKMGHSVAAK